GMRLLHSPAAQRVYQLLGCNWLGLRGIAQDRKQKCNVVFRQLHWLGLLFVFGAHASLCGYSRGVRAVDQPANYRGYGPDFPLRPSAIGSGWTRFVYCPRNGFASTRSGFRSPREGRIFMFGGLGMPTPVIVLLIL